MIVRIWKAKTSRAKADAYCDFLQRTAYTDYGEVVGNRGWFLTRRPLDDVEEVMLVSFWDSTDALRAYAGDDYERPHYFPDDLEALIDPPQRVDHYEMLDLQMR